MKGGAWVNPTDLVPLTQVEEQLRIEILSRSINNLWRKPSNSTRNKMWVIFVNLADDNSTMKCANDRSGPQLLKYCADGGVYYAYNFVEEGDHLGRLGYPWGADKLNELGINPAVSRNVL